MGTKSRQRKPKQKASGYFIGGGVESIFKPLIDGIILHTNEKKRF